MNTDAVAQRVREERKRQGLPEKITDPSTLDKVAAIIAPVQTNEKRPASTTGRSSRSKTEVRRDRIAV